MAGIVVNVLHTVTLIFSLRPPLEAPHLPQSFQSPALSTFQYTMYLSYLSPCHPLSSGRAKLPVSVLWLCPSTCNSARNLAGTQQTPADGGNELVLLRSRGPHQRYLVGE